MVFKFLWCLVMKKMKSLCLLLLKTLPSFEDPYRNPLQNACSAIQEASFDFSILLEKLFFLAIFYMLVSSSLVPYSNTNKYI